MSCLAIPQHTLNRISWITFHNSYYVGLGGTPYSCSPGADILKIRTPWTKRCGARSYNYRRLLVCNGISQLVYPWHPCNWGFPRSEVLVFVPPTRCIYFFLTENTAYNVHYTKGAILICWIICNFFRAIWNITEKNIISNPKVNQVGPIILWGIL